MTYAKHRLNFDFEGAMTAMFGAERGMPYDVAEAMRGWANDISDRSEIWLLREVLHTAEISFRNGAYADFVGRGFRLSEGLSDHVIDRWTDEEVFAYKPERNPEGKTFHKKVVSEEWLDKHVDAWELLDKKRIDLDRGVTRKTLLVLADYFAGTNNTRRQVIKYLNRIDELGSFRNQMPFAHGYKGVSLDLLMERYKTNRDDEMLRNLKWLFEQVTGEPPGENPYDALNKFISDLVHSAQESA